MIVAETTTDGWPDYDWSTRADVAVFAAIRASQYASIATWPVDAEVAIRLTSDDDVRTLNRQYRQQDKPTNVLSFPMVQPDLIESLSNTDANDCAASGAGGEILLGDIVLAYGVCAHEAAEKGVSLEDHTAHLIVHGVLHLLGHDHMNDVDADAMEAIERAAMAAMGLHDPYQDSEIPK